MKRLFLLEDDLSLINGLTFAVKKEGYEIDVARTTLEADTLWINDKYDLVIYVADFDTASNYTVRRVEWIKLMAANAPWFVQDIPTLFISLANPYHLLDVPMIKTYINGYSHNDVVIQSLVNKLVGKEKFVGVSPVDAFCGKWDTKR